MQRIIILGATGSIGCSTLEVIRQNLGKYSVFALTANSQVDKIFEQCIEFIPEYAAMVDSAAARKLEYKLREAGSTTKVISGLKDISHLVMQGEVDIVMSAIVGASGLLPTFNAVKAGKKVLLANKESLISGGELIMSELKKSGAQLLPVDSEHSAIFQCLEGNRDAVVRRIILTASGGPFRKLSKAELEIVTPEAAIKHPNWSMGPKISVDSSTLMNKGLEVIEAFWLFGEPISKIEVVVHPQSIIHSMVEYIDGSIMAQLGTADMKTPIAYALGYPERIHSGCRFLDFKQLNDLTFEAPDMERFPCLGLAFRALEYGGAAPLVLNAANEIAVAAFLEHRLNFYGISSAIEQSMENFVSTKVDDVDTAIELDQEVRRFTTQLITARI